MCRGSSTMGYASTSLCSLPLMFDHHCILSELATLFSNPLVMTVSNSCFHHSKSLMIGSQSGLGAPCCLTGI